MIGEPSTGRLQHVAITGRSFDGLKIATSDGRPAQLAVLDEHGNVIEIGPEVAAEVWAITILAYRQFLRGEGHLTVHSAPPAKPWEVAA